MTDYCEIVEDLVTATSTCPATDVIVVLPSTGASTSSVFPGITQPLITSSGVGVSSTPLIDAYALVISTAATTDAVISNTDVTHLAASTARGRSELFATFNETVVSSGTATDSIVLMDVPVLLVAMAQAVSTALGNTVAGKTLTSEAHAQATVSIGLLETAISAAVASSSVEVLRTLEEVLVSTAAASGSILTASGVTQTLLLISEAESASAMFAQLDAYQLLISTAEAAANVSYKDPARLAWLMNTETTAASWYDNFDFESIAQVAGRTLAVGPDGLYELAGGTDSGDQIDAEVVSGMTDFGVEQVKRVDTMHFSYTSAGTLGLAVEAYESGYGPFEYSLEQREADAPRNSRVTPGKGHYGRYWRMTIRNENGVDFEVHDASVDIAVSSRRM